MKEKEREELNNIIERLNDFIQTVPARIRQFSDQELSAKPMGKWSKKEIMGHLCDSATNNHHRFVRIQFEDQPFKVLPYDQNNWVLTQDYQNMAIDEIVEFWVAMNRHLVRVISRIPKEKLQYICFIRDKNFLTLFELIKDYLRHMEHHFKTLFDM